MTTATHNTVSFADALGIQSGDDLRVGTHSVSEIAREVGTPYYAYSGDALVKHVRAVKEALGPGQCDLYFSIKANPSMGICQLIAAEGIGAEVASGGELCLALKAGFPASRIIFAGPGKTYAELELAVRNEIQTINAESENELERIASIAKSLQTRARVALRINPRKAMKGASMRMSGGAQQFGIDEESLPQVAGRFRDNANLEIVGIHVYSGTQVFEPSAVVEQCASVAEIAIKTGEMLDAPVEVVDFGGGFGVPYYQGSPEFDLDEFGNRFDRLISDLRENPALSSTQFIVELGRYLVAGSGVYVTRVTEVKESRGSKIAVTDGGMNHHITATGNFGQVFRKPYPMAVVNKMESDDRGETMVAGPCCTPLDVFGRQVELPEVGQDDLIGVFLSGAYGFSASSLLFLSHPAPAEVLSLDGKMHVLREPGTFEDLIGQQRPLVTNR